MKYRQGWFILTIVLCGLLLVGWQETPPLSLAAVVDIEASDDERVVVRLTVTNRGDVALEEVVVEVVVPEGLSFVEAEGEAWLVSETPPGTVRCEAAAPLAAGASEELVLTLAVLPSADAPAVLDDYRASAQGIEAPVTGAAVTLWAPPVSTATPSPTPQPSPTTPPATSTAAPTRTPLPTATTPPSPTPTITVVAGVLPTEIPPTPTPNLSKEQERIGTWTVSIFLALVLIILVLTVIWLVRSHRST